MKAYLITSGAVFGLVVVAHVLKVIDEGIQLAREPGFILLTLLAVALCVWAGWLLRQSLRSR